MERSETLTEPKIISNITQDKNTIKPELSKNLTNEQKLEYLSKLIQDAEQNLDINRFNKSLIKISNKKM